MLEQAVAAFIQEAHEILSELEDQILGLEGQPDQATIDAIFRGLHTVKGSGSMFGYTQLAAFTHHFENAFEQVRSGTLPINRDLIDLSLAARDRMEEFLELGGDGADAETLLKSPETVALIDKIKAMTGSGDANPSHSARVSTVEPGQMQTFGIRFSPLKDALRNGMRPDLLMTELEELGQVEVQFSANELPDLKILDPSDSWITWSAKLTTDKGLAAVQDVFIFADDADLDIWEVEETDEVAVSPDAAVEKPEAVEKQEKPQPAGKQESIRIASSKLDGMMDSIGELVIAQARLDAVSEDISNPALHAVVEEVERLVLSLRDVTLAIRMLPIENVFGKFRRVVRDLSSELGKDVRLITSGGETEVDKNVIDRLGDPLVHMIRNSIDHGIETAEIRKQAGKPAQGTVSLSARQEGGEILILIEDNGGGLNRDKIRERAVKNGLIAEDADLSERELYALIFEPGFSTAETVSSVSGRGVGMDAVRTTIDGLGGNIDVESALGQGTRITLRLPVTMAIIDGLRVRLGQSVFVIPLSSVEECVEMDEDETKRTSGRSVLQIREQVVPYLTLDTLFNMPKSGETNRRVVVVRVDGQRIGLVVDDILGQGQTVVKSLSPYHRELPGLGGATILSDGRVALIMDVATLVRWAQSQAADIQKVA
ncbi:Chemotaxis protein CheA [Pelagimonas phthalicica]|uniref:Chemotaxis protein CheA n=1 Tax=Pelagimonas phthalicica TaxID=1037362 RepID=A0A238JB93_9RHOB|nr:chemotaxis protein CheA [Pelagimonas phthalicica]TDS93991.1 two-component system chemotaxis sensor kinase CheA [Pelagimonas phthalicica]SMX27484.1 Chemotaxis protein CheA [Pelagimonas phthalicica]